MHVKEIKSKVEAIALGQNRGWCTANPNSHYYDRDYNTKIGRLFVIYKEPKIKPQYQIFFSFRGGVELKAKFNKFVEVQKFLDTDGFILREWYFGVLDTVQRKYKGDNRQLDSREASQDIFRHPDIFEDNRAEKFTFEVEVEYDSITNIHEIRELPRAHSLTPGSVIHVREGGTTLIVSKKYNGRPCYLVVITADIVREPVDLATGLRPSIINHSSQKAVLTVEEPEEILYRLIEYCCHVDFRYYQSIDRSAMPDFPNFDQHEYHQNIACRTIERRIPAKAVLNSERCQRRYDHDFRY